MSRSLEEMLVVKPKRPTCDMMPDTGSHKALAVVRYRITRTGWKDQFANICAKHERLFIERSEKASLTLDPVETWG